MCRSRRCRSCSCCAAQVLAARTDHSRCRVTSCGFKLAQRAPGSGTFSAPSGNIRHRGLRPPAPWPGRSSPHARSAQGKPGRHRPNAPSTGVQGGDLIEMIDAERVEARRVLRTDSLDAPEIVSTARACPGSAGGRSPTRSAAAMRSSPAEDLGLQGPVNVSRNDRFHRRGRQDLGRNDRFGLAIGRIGLRRLRCCHNLGQSLASDRATAKPLLDEDGRPARRHRLRSPSGGRLR